MYPKPAQTAKKMIQKATFLPVGQPRNFLISALNRCRNRYAHSNSLDQMANPSSTSGMPPGPGSGPVTRPRQISSRPANPTATR